MSTDGQWRNQTSSAADKGNGFKVTLGMVDVWHHFLSSFPGFLKPKTLLLSGEEPFSPCFPSNPQPEVTNDALRKRQIKVQIAQFESKHFICPPILSEDGLP